MLLRSAPLHMSALFPDHIISKAEEEICHFDKHTPGPSRKAPRYHPYAQSVKPRPQDTEQKSALPAWKQIRRGHRSNGQSCFFLPATCKDTEAV